MSPLVLFHIVGGTLGLVTGVVAVTVAKGEPLHRIFGTVFCAAMLMMASLATVLAIPLQQWGNVVAGIFTCYLVVTAWLTVRRKENTVGKFDIAAMLVAATGAVALLIFGLQAAAGGKPPPGGAPITAYFVMAGVFGLAAGLDLKVILKGGISGAARIARHLWRMCFALFIASGSFYIQFIVRKHHLPAFLHHAPQFYFPVLAPLLLILFWMIRVRLTNWFKHAPASAAATT